MNWNNTVEELWSAFAKIDKERAETEVRIQNLELEVAILEAELQLAKMENDTWKKTVQRFLETTAHLTEELEETAEENELDE
jgi:septal ring factor EnvC (AmiA/AmiB activator)